MRHVVIFRYLKGLRFPIMGLPFLCLAIEPLAIKIRECSDIKGVECGDREHKSAFFADDILLMVSMPITTLPNLYGILQPFSRLSGLSTNEEKSTALNISLSDRTSYKFVWEPVALPYLGSYITTFMQTLYSQNYPALYKRLTTDLTNWQIHHPSWFGRLHSIKMNILPRIPYIFRTLPIALVRTDLLKFQRKLFQFLWGTRDRG